MLPGAAAAIRRLNQRGILTVLTTNQAGVGRGYLTEAVLALIHARLKELLSARGARLDAIYYAPTHPQAALPQYRREDPMRKPGTGMIEQACRELPIDLDRAYVVGDKTSDLDMARRAGLKAVFVLSGYGLGEYEFNRQAWTVQPDHVAEDLRAAVAWIVRDLRRRRPERAPRLRRPASKILNWERARRWVETQRARGRRIVLANGCFDLLHGGHVSYLEAARAEGDALLVGVNSDASERRIKGPGRPILHARQRAELVAGMEAVDAVVIFDEPTCEQLLREFRPDVHAKGTDYTTETVPEGEVARELGLRIAIAGPPKENASKDLIAAIVAGQEPPSAAKA